MSALEQSSAFDQAEKLNESIAAAQIKLQENSFRMQEIDTVSIPAYLSAKNANPTGIPGLQSEYSQLQAENRRLQKSIQDNKQAIKDLAARDEERALKRFTTALQDEQKKFADEFNKVVAEKEETLARRTSEAQQAEKQERVVEVEKKLPPGNLVPVLILGVLIFG